MRFYELHLYTRVVRVQLTIVTQLQVSPLHKMMMIVSAVILFLLAGVYHGRHMLRCAPPPMYQSKTYHQHTFML